MSWPEPPRLPTGLLDLMKENYTGAWHNCSQAITHGHPVSLVAATLQTEALVQLLNGLSPDKLINHLLDIIPAIENNWNSELLETLWKGPGFNNPIEFFRVGTEKCRYALEMVEQKLNSKDSSKLDPSELFGEGWCAHEALAIALYCFLNHPQEPAEAVKKAVFSNGPSDSLGAITGALGGAYTGSDAWPADWYSHIEYKDEILEISRIIGRKALI